jgi:predicted nucleic acid-binding protein
MLRRTVYIETTIPSYLAARRSRDLVVAARQQLTVEWWETRRHAFALSVSQVVVDEAAARNRILARQRLALIKDLPVLEVTDQAERIGSMLLKVGPLPPTAARDALHIAVAAVHRIDYLLTWNCTHLANAEISRDIERIILRTGLVPPRICTPEGLMGGTP